MCVTAAVRCALRVHVPSEASESRQSVRTNKRMSYSLTTDIHREERSSGAP